MAVNETIDGQFDRPLVGVADPGWEKAGLFPVADGSLSLRGRGGSELFTTNPAFFPRPVELFPLGMTWKAIQAVLDKAPANVEYRFECGDHAWNWTTPTDTGATRDPDVLLIKSPNCILVPYQSGLTAATDRARFTRRRFCTGWTKTGGFTNVYQVNRDPQFIYSLAYWYTAGTVSVPDPTTPAWEGWDAPMVNVAPATGVIDAASRTTALAALDAATVPSFFMDRYNAGPTYNTLYASFVGAAPNDASVWFSFKSWIQNGNTFPQTSEFGLMLASYANGVRQIEFHGMEFRGACGVNNDPGLKIVGASGTEQVTAYLRDCFARECGMTVSSDGQPYIPANSGDGIGFYDVASATLDACGAGGIVNDGLKFNGSQGIGRFMRASLHGCYGNRFGLRSVAYSAGGLQPVANAFSVHNYGHVDFLTCYGDDSAGPVFSHAGGGLLVATNCRFRGSVAARGNGQGVQAGVYAGVGGGILNAAPTMIRLVATETSANLRGINVASGTVELNAGCITGTGAPASNASADTGNIIVRR